MKLGEIMYKEAQEKAEKEKKDSPGGKPIQNLNLVQTLKNQKKGKKTLKW